VVWGFKFFFAFRKQVYGRYQEFFEYEVENDEVVSDGNKEAPKLSQKEATGRFYFQCFKVLTNGDITKWEAVSLLPLYLCLNHLASHKEEIIKENDRIRKEQAQWRSTSR